MLQRALYHQFTLQIINGSRSRIALISVSTEIETSRVIASGSGISRRRVISVGSFVCARRSTGSLTVACN